MRTLCRMLKLSEEDIGPDQALGVLGFDSYSGMRLINRIKDAYDLTVSPERLLEYNTVETLSGYLVEKVDTVLCENKTRRNDRQNNPKSGGDTATGEGRSETLADGPDIEMRRDEDPTPADLNLDDLNLDELPESELDRLLRQHLSDE